MLLFTQKLKWKKAVLVKTVSVYFLCGSLWILISDYFAWSRLQVDHHSYYHWDQTLKGLLFITGTTIFLYFLLRRNFSEIVEREEVFRVIAEQRQQGIWIVDREGMTVYYNPTQLELLHLTAREVYGEAPIDFLPAVDPQELMEMRENIRRGMTQNKILSFYSPEKELIHLHVVATPLFDEYGEYDGAVGMSMDITDRLNAEKDLQLQKDHLKMMIQNLPLGLLGLNSEGKLEYTNDLGEEYIDQISQNSEFESSSRESSLLELVEKFSPQKWHNLSQQEADDKEEQTFQIFHTPLPEGMKLLVIRDISHQEQLRQKAETQDRLAAVGQMATGIAHDFNNLLQGIIGYSELIENTEDLSNQVKEDLHFINQQGLSAARMIRQIMDFSRTSKSEKISLDLVPLTKEMVKMFKRMMSDDIQFHFDYENLDHLIKGDPTQIQQILTNLVVNAQDAMPDGGDLYISLGLEEVPKPRSLALSTLPAGDWVVFTVKDTGKGIPIKVLPRIFEPFFTYDKKGKGTGLGLEQVYGLTHKHDGHIDVKSRPNQGTTFRVYLPTLKQPHKEMERTRLKWEKGGNGEKILVAEDDKAVRELLETVLEKLGFTPVITKDGREALKKYESDQGAYPVIITDMNMPNMGGQDLIKEIRRRDKKVKIVVLTGYPLDEEMPLLATKQVQRWLKKPVTIQKISETLKELLHLDGED